LREWILALRKDLGTPAGRYLIMQTLVRCLPGRLGTKIRSWVLGRRFKRAGPGLRLSPGVRLFGVEKLAVGANCQIGFDNIIQAHGGVEMGDNVVLGPGVNIWSVNHVYADPYRPIIEQGYDHKPVVIGSNVWIGANAFVMPGAHIGDGVVISAGSVVGGKAVEPYAVLAGNPARKIGSRLPPADNDTMTLESELRLPVRAQPRHTVGAHGQQQD
jgi:acetyltransferase-like isoleucine patch superfamily enzyme